MVTPPLIRAFRLPFLTASVLPYLVGAGLARQPFHPLRFTLGLLAVALTHLSANLINDYADHRSGIDDHDTSYYGLFGGSKLIQHNRLSPAFFLWTALLTLALAIIAVVTLAIILHQPALPIIMLAVATLAWAYSTGPALAHHGFGELIIFLLFGPTIVIGAAYLQTATLPAPEIWLLSCPLGLLTTALLVANELPDCPDDLKGGKRTLVARVGPNRTYLLFASLVSTAYLIILAAFLARLLGPLALLSLAALPLALYATLILKQHPARKRNLLNSSRLAIALHATVAITLILEAWL